MIRYLIKKIFGVTIVTSLGRTDDGIDHRTRHRQKVTKILEEQKRRHPKLYQKNN